jgi:diguanylate cyclase (GGDEF)-like protein
MFIHEIVETNTISFISFSEIFAQKHLIMAGYFTVLGGVIGIFRAVNTHKKDHLFEEIKRLSVTDELTTLHNRRYFLEQLNMEIKRAGRYSHSLSLLMIDLNDFKQYNDTYGHLKGDELLVKLARLLKNSVRSPDFVARYGGDEFVVVMPESGEDEAVQLAERLNTVVDSNSFDNPLGPKIKKVSISLGTSTFPIDAEDVSGLISVADSRLYMEKRYKAA